MAVRVTHPFVSAIPDSGDTTIVQPSNWNADHAITGLGTAAEANTTDFATAAQGALADSATQPGDLATVATTGAYSDLSGLPTLGTASAQNVGYFATAAQGALADSAVQPAAITNMLETTDIGVSVQAYDADLTTWAGLTPSANAQSLVTAANYAAMRALLDLEAGTDFLSPAAIAAAYQPLDADLTAWAGVNPSSYSTTAQIAAAYQPLDSDLTAIAALTTTTYGRALLALASTTAVQSYIGVREVLTAARTYYVRSDGSDSNTGLANTAGGAFLTLQKAMDTIKSTLDTAGYTVTIQGDGSTWTAGLIVYSWVGGGNVTFDGGGGTISRTSATCITIAGLGGLFTYQNVTLTTTTGGNGVSHTCAGKVSQGASTVFGAIAGAAAISLSVPGAYHENLSAYSITGNQVRHFHVTAPGAQIVSSSTLTLTGTPAFSSFFANTSGGGNVTRTGTISGAATGTRYAASSNSVINTGGGGASYLPGNVAGSTSTGGQYL